MNDYNHFVKPAAASAKAEHTLHLLSSDYSPTSMPNRPASVSPKGIVRMLMAALLIKAHNSKTAQLPRAERETERYSHTMTLHSNERNNGNAILWMNLTSIALSETET